jgi:hypothetical protein
MNNETLTFAHNAILQVRALSIANNTDFSALRMGNYITADGTCATIVTFVHKWMDSMGWGLSDNCKSNKQLMIHTSHCM